ncbi:Protein CBG04703 [Caenorhabditis briggsae]|uniref:Uncharacterized protein n=2 Tax=Caenorhabditis briggsae TaxID=6238 RepID=A0AAE9A2B0_CAEBR|nr:Protein CBG04703 [Caenorhabditis briggsae]ULT91568.1 hypothetical protein L3Y34_009288 [Caenorhabditis briggsae]UMM37178.1 hypothetical protein L5515_009035 [Caenorhabditis briggsae]CAP25356.1 Protein CBG04703 [Caenorhabditis briggsae]
MGDPKLPALIALVVLAFVANAVAVFTPAWVCMNDYQYDGNYGCTGIVPYYANLDPAWFAAASWLMFISFATFLLMFFFVYNARSKIHHHGYGSHTRKWFHFIALAAFLIVMFTVAAVTLIGVYVSTSFYSDEFYLGYSVWISIGAGVVCLGIMGLAFALSRKDGCC